MSRQPLPRYMHLWTVGLWISLSAALLLTACATPTPAQLSFSLSDTDAQRFWPALPEVPRYRYAGQLTGEENFKSERGESGGFVRAMRWLVGIDNQQASANALQRPQSGTTDVQGRIFVTDISRQAVFIFDAPAGKLHIQEWARSGTRFVAPVGITLGAGTQLLVADAELGRVFRLDRQGKPLDQDFGSGILERPTGLTRDPQRGLIYVADTRAHNIKIFDDAGKLVDVLGQRGSAPGEFNAPTHLAFKNDKLYVSDTLNSRIQIFDVHGRVIKTFGARGLYVGNLTRPKGVTVDDEGNIYTVESYHDHLLVFDAGGRFLLPIGGTGNGVGEFYLPAGIWSDQYNRIYVADMFNGRIMVFQYLGGT